MKHIPPALHYLMTETGLNHDRTLYLFSVGYPWPIFRGAALTQLGTDLVARRLSRESALASPLAGPLPCLHELRTHILNVVFATGILPEILFHLWRAMQIYTMEHRDWNQDDLAAHLGLTGVSSRQSGYDLGGVE